MKTPFLPALAVLSLLASCQERAAPAATSPETTVTPPPVVSAPPTADSPSAVPTPVVVDTVDEPAAVVRRYYAAINARDYRTAYAQWGDDGRASKQTYEQFTAGFAQTQAVTPEVGAPGRIEGAAGSRYVAVPISLRATTRDGQVQQFAGSYTLRKTVVDGASAEQRRWHLYSAKLKETK